MKNPLRTTSRLIWTGMMAGVLAAFVTPRLRGEQTVADAGPASLLANGNFETDMHGAGWPDGWGKAPGISWQTEDGEHFMHVTVQKAGETEMLYRTVSIGPAVKGIEITIRYRTAGAQHGSRGGDDARAIFVDEAPKFPIMVSEVGCPQKWEDFSFIPPGARHEKLGPNCTWPADMLGLIQKYKLNWTGFSFNPHCGPPVIQDWSYTPTSYWGVFVKAALSGKQYVMTRMR